VTPWGADCSGLVQTVFGMHGVALPRMNGRVARRDLTSELPQIPRNSLLSPPTSGTHTISTRHFNRRETLKGFLAAFHQRSRLHRV
jgi:cell wall-associated NlpC family hydrolase